MDLSWSRSSVARVIVFFGRPFAMGLLLNEYSDKPMISKLYYNIKLFKRHNTRKSRFL
jgi:hypothetical protein